MPVLSDFNRVVVGEGEVSKIYFGSTLVWSDQPTLADQYSADVIAYGEEGVGNPVEDGAIALIALTNPAGTAPNNVRYRIRDGGAWITALSSTPPDFEAITLEGLQGPDIIEIEAVCTFSDASVKIIDGEIVVEGEGLWPDPPSGLTEWVRLELDEGSGDPADKSGNDRVVTLESSGTWGASEGHTAVINGGTGAAIEIAGPLVVENNFSVRFRGKFTEQQFGSIIYNHFNSGLGRIEIGVNPDGAGLYFFMRIDNGTIVSQAEWHSGNAFALNTLVDVLLTYNNTSGQQTITYYDPTDRTTVLLTASTTPGGNGILAGETPEQNWVRIGGNPEWDIVDVTIYTS